MVLVNTSSRRITYETKFLSCNTSWITKVFSLLVILLSAQVARGQDYFFSVPTDAQATKELIEDIKDTEDVPGSDAAIIYQELVEARSRMLQYRKYKTSIHPADFDDIKKDFNDRIAGLQNDAGNCDHQTSMDVHTRLGELVAGVNGFGFSQQYTRTVRELNKLVAMRPEDFCKLLKAKQLTVIQTHDQEVDIERKISADQITYANQIADAYQDRYRKLQKASSRTSEATVLRITLLVIVVGVCLFAWLIFRGVAIFPEKLQSELVVSGQLIQFPTVMILLVVVVVLGLSNILDDKTLGTLLGGIAGYVLSQGIGRAASRETERALSQRPNPVSGGLAS